MEGIELLDCTLRDGGYVNEWRWGHDIARDIVGCLTKAKVDYVEVGFLRNVDIEDSNVVCSNRIEELNKLLPNDSGNVHYVAMAMCSNYDINKLIEYQGNGIEIIRVTAHKYDILDGLEFARKVKAKGYKVCINPIDIMGYDDSELIEIVRRINEINPYAFSIVDTFGSMTLSDLERIFSIVSHNLIREVKIGIHLHENRALSFSLAIHIIQKRENRKLIIDGSLMGMGRNPGNLQMELIADYINGYGERYDIDCLLDAIQDDVSDYYGRSNWGYSPVFFLSAKYNVHRNYAEHFLEKGFLTNREIKFLISNIGEGYKTKFDAKYADLLYKEFLGQEIDDRLVREELKSKFEKKKVAIICPGKSIRKYKNQIKRVITSKDYITISVNFLMDDYSCDYAFFNHNKRLDKYREIVNEKLILCSNIDYREDAYFINIKKIYDNNLDYNNALVMLLNLLTQIGIDSVEIIGADGFDKGRDNYCTELIKETSKRNDDYNQYIKNKIKQLKCKIAFVTPSQYE